ncbi:MFS transporter [Kosmotoga olearia]|uniref:Major facilitator superfamily MFS_1 n=1 Tax=Kosmotoga olearia (strain ATCC BAA-1733 / DSM 21960 / TBF 19.5.1) TaxID=521045 RepID=C5CJ17_KOSOT|nr:MFS transporter [Kosmotoga olearia]ACR79933.1 major facilitator superfamily MFS_1 [Kosmotoga olearia TBF 19.5.1]MDK2953756.1 transporter, family, 3-phenylpropionic acid transporter [Kosmotoga sp.]
MFIWDFIFEALTYSSFAARSMLGQFFDIAGFSPVEIGYLVAMLPLVALISNPFWFRVGSRITDKKAFIIVSLISGFLFWPIYISRNFILGLISIAAFSFFFSAVVPLGDSLMMASIKKHGGTFDKIRLFGTIGFSITALLLSYLVKWGFIWYFIVASISLFIAPIVINIKRKNNKKIQEKPKTVFIRNGNLFTFVLMTVGMIFGVTLGSFHNTFFPVLSREMGYDKSVVGLVFSFMAITEIPFLFFAEKIIRKFGNFSVLVVGMLVSALRVVLVTYVSGLVPLLLTQALHGLTYILMYYALFNYIHFRLPEKYLTNAQSLFWLTSSGLTYIFGSIIGGYLIEYFQTVTGFRIMGYSGFIVTGAIIAIFLIFKRKTS